MKWKIMSACQFSVCCVAMAGKMERRKSVVKNISILQRVNVTTDIRVLSMILSVITEIFGRLCVAISGEAIMSPKSFQ